MRSFALASLVLSLLSGCTSSSAGPSEPIIGNGRCTCDSGLCVQEVGTPSPAALSCEAVASGMTCAGLSTSGRRCWGSPNTSGLCLCAGAPAPQKMASR